MASSNLTSDTSQFYDLDSTDQTQEGGGDATDQTQEDGADATDQTQEDDGADATDQTQEAHLSQDHTEETRDKFSILMEAAGGAKIPASEIIVRNIGVEPSAPLAALPADSDAAFSQWLAGSQLARN